MSALPQCFLDVRIGPDGPTERIVIQLRADVVPKTAANFLALCTGERGTSQSGAPLDFAGSKFHRIVRACVCGRARAHAHARARGGGVCGERAPAA